MADTLKDIPEFFENELGEAINSRTESLGTFRELGPPDLCHITKSNAKPGVKEVGSYHYVSGVDASSSASLAAYLNMLNYSLDETHAWFSKSSAWRIRSGIYCCFNAFARVDVRVEVKIPGGVESYTIDLRGETHKATSEIWQQTYISALLRSILYSDDSSYRLAGFRKMDPIPNLQAEAKFVEAAEQLFFQGWQLGSVPEIQVATSVNNHLTAGIMKYFGDSFRYDPADPEVAALLSQAYIGLDEEIKAVNILYDALKSVPMSYALLHTQVDFLRAKNKHDIALKLAKHAVNNTPSEFVTWAKLTEVYIDLSDYESALLTLNSCPMFTYSERDMHRMPTPARTHLPIKPEIMNSGIMEEDTGRDSDADPNLFRLPAPALHGTFSKAYSLLTRLVAKIGWDELLKCRSGVFVMEEEYRMQKAVEEERKGSAAMEGLKAARAKRESLVAARMEEKAEEKAEEEAKANGEAEEEAEEKREEKEEKEEKSEEKNEDDDKLAEELEDVKLDDGEEKKEDEESEEERLAREQEEALKAAALEESKMEKPQQAAEEQKELKDATNGKNEYSFSFSNKRLCERWLDNLFMVLYEDLRVYTVWRTEVSHYKAQHMPYRKTGTEWEILGDLASRLHHKEEAKEAYQQCLDHKFSAKAWMKLLEIYADEGNVQKALVAVVKLTVYHERWYHEIVYPTAISHNLNKLIRTEGLSKMQNMLISMNLPPPVFKLVTRYFTFAEVFRVDGSDF
ncbi:hypothetical protein BC937DRAFT_91754 [Endogone sp. FLAS-F59071]|nr:hypothetical protein BC937DRAFT_91754 [Endogone sp. FLAS-F59071]|eukprot:RUS23169.1 hypothetical protein BC937DRAFT_91754 [Endogone sp. FLAS-F59071]